MISRNIGWGLFSAGLILAASVAIVMLKRAGLVDGDAAIRLCMAVTGATMVWLGNQTPKKALPATPRKLAYRRFSGWAIVLGGLANMAIWTFAPMDVAAMASIVPIAIAVIAILAYCLRSRGAASPQA